MQEQELKPFFIPYPAKLPIKIHTEDSVKTFSKYLDGSMYKFPLGTYSVNIPEYLITTINTDAYFIGYMSERGGATFGHNFEVMVNDIDSFIKDGIRLFNETHDDIVRQTHLFMIASGLLEISEDEVKNSAVMTEQARTEFFSLWADIKEISNSPQSDSRQKQMLNELVRERKNNVMSSLELGFCHMIADMMTLYKASLLAKYNYRGFKLPFTNEEAVRMKNIRDNTIMHITDKEQILETLSKSFVYDLSNYEPLKFLVRTFYTDSEILSQLEVIADFLLMSEKFKMAINEAKNEEHKRLQEEQDRKRSQLSSVFMLPENSSAEIEKKIFMLRQESEKIGYDALSDLKELEETLKRVQAQEEKARLEREKQQREAKLNKALAMPENSSEEIRRKIQAVKLEADKIGYNVGHKIKELSERLKEAELSENNKRLGSIANDIIWEAIIYPLNSAAALSGIAKYFHGMVYGSADNDAFMNSKLDDIYHLYAGEMEYPYEEIPILYYDDTLSKNGKDSLLITPFKVYSSIFGETSSIAVQDAKEFSFVNKLFNKSVMINGTFKISAALVDGKHMAAFTELLKMAAYLAGVVRSIFTEDPEGHLARTDDEEGMRYILDELQKAPINEEAFKKFVEHFYAMGYDHMLKDAPERFRKILAADEKDAPLGTDIIIKAAHSVEIDNIYFEVGNPAINSSSRKYGNARSNFRIPDSEQIFLIFDATILGGVRKGFAFCTTGLYYCAKSPGYMDWAKFSKIRIEKSTSGIKIGSEEFLCAIDTQMLKILTNLQELIREKLK